METERKELARPLGGFEVFSLAAGAMISSGLFILPAVIYPYAGPGIVLSYLLASLLILPSVFAKAELTSAMPRSGGTYFYAERSFGTLWGIFTGLANWLSLTLKSAFAIVGLTLFMKLAARTVWGAEIPPWLLDILAVACCAVFGVMNLFSVKSAAWFQNLLVLFLLAVLAGFVLWGSRFVTLARLSPFLPGGWKSVFWTSGFVFISFGGLTSVDNVAEEVRRAGKVLAGAVLAAWAVVSFLYTAVVFTAVGVLDGPVLQNSPMPLSAAADQFAGIAGFVLLTLAAVAAFLTTANGGLLAASRCPMSMSRDHLLPAFISRVHPRFQTPYVSILLTCTFMTVALVALNLEELVKTASTLMILLFILDNASIIVMRESRIQSYRPDFRAPLYPYLQILTILLYCLLLLDMGAVPLSICGVFLLFSAAWYILYARPRSRRESALAHIVQRITDKPLKSATLETELREILLQRDEVSEDRFDKLIRRCPILDLQDAPKADEVFHQIAGLLSARLGLEEERLFRQFLQREQEGSTIIHPGIAVPHVIVEGRGLFDIVLVRAEKGVLFPHSSEPVTAIFALVGSKDERNFHLRALTAVAQIIQHKDFSRRWKEAPNSEGLRNIFLLTERKREHPETS
ncbi:MAG: amino acid permease [Anaerohalosphaeraceae bacterium]